MSWVFFLPVLNSFDVVEIAKELDLHGRACLSTRWPRIASAREIRRSPGRDNGISAAVEWQADTRKVPGVRLVHRLASHRFVSVLAIDPVLVVCVGCEDHAEGSDVGDQT